MRTFSKFALTATFGFALAFTFSCSSNDSGEQSYNYCVMADDTCLAGPFTASTCKAQLSNSCPDGSTPIVGGSSSSKGGSGGSFNPNSQIYKDALYIDGDCDCIRSSIGVPYTGSGIIKAYDYNAPDDYRDIRIGSVTNGIVKLELPTTIPDESLTDFFRSDESEKIVEKCTSYPKNIKLYSPGWIWLTNGNGDDDIALSIHYSDEQIWERIEYVYFSEAGKITCNWTDEDKDVKDNYNIDAKKGWNRLYYRYVINKDGYRTYEVSTNNILTKEGQLKWLIWIYN